MEQFLEWLLNLKFYWYIVFAVVVFGLVMLVLKYRTFKRLAYEFVVYAEKTMTGTKLGQERFKFVVSKIYSFIPLTLKPILTEKRIIKIIEWAVKTMKKELEKGLIK